MPSSTSCSRAVVGARRAADDAPVSRAPISTSTASPTSSTRACSTAACRASPTPARCASPAGSARSRGSSAMAQEIYPRPPPGRRGAAPDRVALQALSSARCASSLARRTAELRARHPDRLPFDAVSSISGEDGGARPISCSATATAPAARRCSPICVEAALRGRGYTVCRNKPYAGGFITEHYGEPAAGLHALQIEINRGALHGRAQLEKKPAFAVLGGRSPAPSPGDGGSSTGDGDQADRSRVSAERELRGPGATVASLPTGSGQEKRPLLQRPEV